MLDHAGVTEALDGFKNTFLIASSCLATCDRPYVTPSKYDLKINQFSFFNHQFYIYLIVIFFIPCVSYLIFAVVTHHFWGGWR